MSADDLDNPFNNPPSDPRDALRNPYLAREILRCPPAEPEKILREVDATDFSSEMGTLLSKKMGLYNFSDAFPSGTVGLLLPRHFEETYGDALLGSRTATMLGVAIQDYLDVPNQLFTSGGAFDGNSLVQHMVIINRRAWQAMAKGALSKLADSEDGAMLLGLKNVALYHSALDNPQSVTSQILHNLLDHVDLNERDIASWQQKAVASENYEFATQLAARRKRMPFQQHL
jgi:hypothetical protein